MPKDPRPLVPCASCPWRKTTTSADYPGGGVDAEALTRIVAGVGSFSGTVMGCHRMDRNEVCAGYVASEEGQSDLRVRAAVMRGRIRTMEVADVPGGLFPTVWAMLQVHGVKVEGEP